MSFFAEDLDTTRVADKLAELVDYSLSRSETIEGRGLFRTESIQEDGGEASKTALQGPSEWCLKDDGKGNLPPLTVQLLLTSADLRF